MNKLLILSSLIAMLASSVKADMPMGAYPYVTTSPTGRYYLMMLPRHMDGGVMKGPCGIAYQLAHDGSSVELWRTDGWYSLKVYLSEDGKHLIRLERRNLGKEPSGNDVGVAFYDEGKLKKVYSPMELVKERGKIVNEDGHYGWLAIDVLRENSLFSGKKNEDGTAEPRLAWEDNTFRLKTCDSIVYVFDVKTGDIKSAAGR
jgi:hypothetical protein